MRRSLRFVTGHERSAVVQTGKQAERPAPGLQVAALANSAGIGGGAFIVPLMYLGLGFDIKDSTALSQAVIAVSLLL